MLGCLANKLKSELHWGQREAFCHKVALGHCFLSLLAGNRDVGKGVGGGGGLEEKKRHNIQCIVVKEGCERPVPSFVVSGFAVPLSWRHVSWQCRPACAAAAAAAPSTCSPSHQMAPSMAHPQGHLQHQQQQQQQGETPLDNAESKFRPVRRLTLRFASHREKEEKTDDKPNNSPKQSTSVTSSRHSTKCKSQSPTTRARSLSRLLLNNCNLPTYTHTQRERERESYIRLTTCLFYLAVWGFFFSLSPRHQLVSQYQDLDSVKSSLEVQIPKEIVM